MRLDIDDLYEQLCGDDGDYDDDDEDIPFDTAKPEDEVTVRAQVKPAEPEELNVSFADVYGYENVKSALYRIVDMATHAEKYTRLGVRMPHGIMLYGEPGVGKTMMAKAMMHDMHRPVYILRKVQADSAFMEMISAAFEAAAENAPSVILLDDMDKFSSGRGCTNEFAAVQAGIDRVKDKDVLVVATVNDIDRLPGALCRHGRFDRRIEVSLPGIEDSAVIISRYLADKKVSRDVNMKTVAKLLDGYTCASLDSILNDAGMFAGFEDKDEISMRDIIQAVLADIYSVDTTASISAEQKTETAYHEAGHAAASMLLRPGSVSIASVRGKSRGPQGFIQTIGGYGDSYENFCSRIIAGLAGRAATEIKYGSLDMGSSSDICKAGEMCDVLVEDICANGLSYAYIDPRKESDNTMNNRNMQRSRMLEDFYNEAKKLLRGNWNLVECIAKALAEKETLICDDLDAIFADYITGTGRNSKDGIILAGMRRAA